MIVGIGIDIVELDRIRDICQRQPRFIEKVLTKEEIKQYNICQTTTRKTEYVAGRFAAKEAFSKAYGTGIGTLGFKDIEITTNHQGAPIIYANVTTNNHVHISISHSKDYVVAQVIIES